jgi:hypothetical protein
MKTGVPNTDPAWPANLDGPTTKLNDLRKVRCRESSFVQSLQLFLGIRGRTLGNAAL